MKEISTYLKFIKQFNIYNLLCFNLEAYKDSIFSYKVLACVIDNMIINIILYKL